MQALSASNSPWLRARSFVRLNGRGFLVSVVVAVAAKFLSEHYGAPAMLMALLLGIAFHFLAEDDAGDCKAGIEFTARTVLRFGVALLGARISVELMMSLGADLIAVVIAGVILTILFGPSGRAPAGSWLALRCVDGRFGRDLRRVGRDGPVCHSAQKRAFGTQSDFHGIVRHCSVDNRDDRLSHPH